MNCPPTLDAEKHAFDNGSGMTELMTVPEMIAEIQRLGKLLVERQTPTLQQIQRYFHVGASEALTLQNYLSEKAAAPPPSRDHSKE